MVVFAFFTSGAGVDVVVVVSADRADGGQSVSPTLEVHLEETDRVLPDMMRSPTSRHVLSLMTAA